ncbi:MAG: hypothetical protein ACO1OB_22300 [Archangium sp.]
MLSRVDRREWAVLGLMALAWCLVAAPLLHQLTHAHGHRHTHNAPVQQAGNFEHQSVAFTQAPPMPQLAPVLLAMAVEEVPVPSMPWLISARRVAQSQAP